MKKFKCFTKSDTNQEAIAIVEAVDQTAAAKYFAAQKKLEVSKFLSIFSISECRPKNT